MMSRSFVAGSVEQFHEEMAKALDGGWNPTLAFVFSSIALGIQALSEAMGKYEVSAFGCSTDGEILALEGDACTYERKAVVTLVDIPIEAVSVRLLDGRGKTTFELGKEVAEWSATCFDKRSIIVVSGGMLTDGEQMLKGVLSVTGEDVAVFGGMAGDDREFQRTWAFTNGACTDNGAVALVFDATKVDIDGVATSGWIGIGAEKKITRASGNVVYTIDDRPALDVYKEYLSITDDDLPEIGIEYPLLVMRDGGTPVLRALNGVDGTHGALVFAGTVPEGASVKFASSAGFDAIDHVKRDLEAYFGKHPEADLLILFSCMARHLALGPLVADEILFARTQWNTPLIGFFTYGEIGRSVSGTPDFFNETYTLATLRVRD